MKKIRVVLADDHRLFRDGLRRLLELEADIEVIGEARDGVEAIEITRKLLPDLLLLDVNMPHKDGGAVVRELSPELTRVKFVVITAYDDEEHLADLSSAGVDGYVLKSSGLSEFLSAVRSVARGDPYVDPKVAGKLLSSFHKHKEERDQLTDLTQREKEVLFWLSQGYSNAEIAAKMVLSEKTVKNHVSHLLRKLDLTDRTQAAVLAWKMGLAQRAEEFMDPINLLK